MTTVLFDNRTSEVAAARADGGALWLTPADFAAASGWKPEARGLCKGNACVQTNDQWVDGDGNISLTAFADHLNQPLVKHEASDTWAFGESAETRSNDLLSLQAPDFSLPDLDGKMHALSEFRGKKVFLYSWGSY